jgi:hypothetical protein
MGVRALGAHNPSINCLTAETPRKTRKWISAARSAIQMDTGAAE